MQKSAEQRMREIITKSLALDRLGTGMHKIQNGEKLDIFVVEHIWIANIFGYWPTTVTMARAACSRDYYKSTSEVGLLLVPATLEPTGHFIGANPFRAVELKLSEDPVVKALQHINLIEQRDMIIPGNETLMRIDIEVIHWNGHRQIRGHGIPLSTDPTWRELGSALVSTAQQFASLYGEMEIIEFIRKTPIG